jgi:hypothetical protein
MPMAIASTLLPLSLAARSILCAKSAILGITKPAAASTTQLPRRRRQRVTLTPPTRSTTLTNPRLQQQVQRNTPYAHTTKQAARYLRMYTKPLLALTYSCFVLRRSLGLSKATTHCLSLSARSFELCWRQPTRRQQLRYGRAITVSRDTLCVSTTTCNPVLLLSCPRR